MTLTKFLLVDADKDGTVTKHGDIFLDRDEIIGITVLLDMHEVVVNDVSRLFLRAGVHFVVHGTPSTIAERLKEVV